MSERVLTDGMVEEIKAYFPRYATRQAVTLPALHVVNRHLRYVPHQAVIEIAQLLDLAPAEVQDTLTFMPFSSKTRRMARRGPGSVGRSAARCAVASR